MRIETKELIIRNFTLSDMNDLLEYMLQRVDTKFECYPDFTAEKIDAEIKFRSESDEFFAIELKENHKVIGNIYMGKRDFNSRELGYVLNTKYQNKGYGSQAAKATMEYFFSIGTHRVFAEASPENIPSWKTMQKIGMQKEAHFRKNVSFRSDENGNPIYWDTYVFAKLNPNEDN